MVSCSSSTGTLSPILGHSLHERRGNDSLLHSVVADLRASAYLQHNGPAHGVGTPLSAATMAAAAAAAGHVTASPAFPFDAVTGDFALTKATVLVVDLDAVVHDCVRVVRWCAAAAALPATGHAVPTLSQLLCCFLETVRRIAVKTGLQVELVLGNCKDAFADLDEMRWAAPVEHCTVASHSVQGTGSNACGGQASASTPLDASASLVEAAAVWLQVYQTLVLFLAGGGSGVGKAVSFYTTAEPGWTGAAVRVRHLSETTAALNLQLFPLLWSTDPRAFFATASTDVVVSSWLLYASLEVGQLCGRPLPAWLLLSDGALESGAATSQTLLAAWCGPSGALPERLLIRHAPCTARRLGVTSAAYLPSLYALLFLHDTRRAAAAARDAQCASSKGTAASHAKAEVARAVAMVNHYGGTLHSDLVQQWAAGMEACQVLQSGQPSVPFNTTPQVAGDLAALLWTAQGALSTVTARDISSSGRHLRAIWVGGQWKTRGPPPLSCALGTGTLSYSAMTKPLAHGATGEAASVSPQAEAGAGAATAHLRPLRQQLLRLSRHVFDATWQSKDGAGSELADVESGIAAATGRSVYLSCLLAEPLGEAVASTAGPNPPHHPAVRAARDATPLPAWPLAFQTRGSLDDVRERVRPTAQLTLVALSLLWCQRLWSEETCLRVYGFYLAYCEAEGATAAGEAHAAVHSNVAARAESDAHDVPCGVTGCEVATWWHAVSCVTLYHSLTTRIVHEPPHRPADGALPKMLSEPQSVFTGCLPGASYGAADPLSFSGYLRSRGFLLSCCSGSGDHSLTLSPQGKKGQESDGSGTGECPLQVMTAARLERLRHVLPSPACCDEVVHGHHIFELLSSTLHTP